MRVTGKSSGHHVNIDIKFAGFSFPNNGVGFGHFVVYSRFRTKLANKV